jgi:hypothetical protein
LPGTKSLQIPIFKLLFHHDVILEDETGLRFASELMRRWVEEKTCGGRVGDDKPGAGYNLRTGTQKR